MTSFTLDISQQEQASKKFQRKCIRKKQWLMAEQCYRWCVWIEILGLLPKLGANKISNKW
jgi:hypothetical protein